MTRLRTVVTVLALSVCGPIAARADVVLDPSNHGSGSKSAAEVLRRVYGAGGHSIIMANPAVPGLTFHYTRFSQITDDISDARVYGGIHYRFDQDAGADLGRDIGAYVYKHNLRRAKHRDDDEGDRD